MEDELRSGHSRYHGSPRERWPDNGGDDDDDSDARSSRNPPTASSAQQRDGDVASWSSSDPPRPPPAVSSDSRVFLPRIELTEGEANEMMRKIQERNREHGYPASGVVPGPNPEAEANRQRAAIEKIRGEPMSEDEYAAILASITKRSNDTRLAAMLRRAKATGEASSADFEFLANMYYDTEPTAQAALQTAQAELQREQAELRREQTLREREKREAEQRIQNLTTELEDGTSQLEAATLATLDSESRMANMKRILRNLQGEVGDKDEEIVELRRLLRECEEHQRNKSTPDSGTRAIAAAPQAGNPDIDQLREENGALAAGNEGLRERLSRKHPRQANLEAEIGAKDAEIQALKSTIAELKDNATQGISRRRNYRHFASASERVQHYTKYRPQDLKLVDIWQRRAGIEDGKDDVLSAIDKLTLKTWNSRQGKFVTCINQYHRAATDDERHDAVQGLEELERSTETDPGEGHVPPSFLPRVKLMKLSMTHRDYRHIAMVRDLMSKHGEILLNDAPWVRKRAAKLQEQVEAGVHHWSWGGSRPNDGIGNGCGCWYSPSICNGHSEPCKCKRYGFVLLCDQHRDEPNFSEAYRIPEGDPLLVAHDTAEAAG